jgi:membrane protease YdiL (CAAX protease family)
MGKLWARVPALIQALVLGELVVSLGGLPPDLMLFGNLKLFPAVPWALPATCLWLWLLWRYLAGHGWPRSTARSRARDLRGNPLTARIWAWALLAGGLGMLSVVGVSFLTLKLADLPPDAYKLPVDLSRYPVWTVASLLLALSLTAGVVEEAGFRGYMLSRIERRHGWIAGILLTGAVFFLDHHLSHAYATYAFLPFFMLVSCLHGLLVYHTRSILPSVLLHAVADFCVIPFQFGLLGHIDFTSVWKTGIDAFFIGLCAVTLAAALAAIPAFRRLATATRAADGPAAAAPSV